MPLYTNGFEITVPTRLAANQQAISVKGLVGQSMTGKKRSSSRTRYNWAYATSTGDSITLAWRSAEPVQGASSLTGSTIGEYVAGTLWKLHSDPAPTGSDPPLTNSVTNAGILMTFPSAITIDTIRLHNIGSTWGSTRTPKSFRFWGQKTSDGLWTEIYSYGSSVNPDQDTGYLSIPLGSQFSCTNYFFWFVGDGGNTAQSICRIDATAYIP